MGLENTSDDSAIIAFVIMMALVAFALGILIGSCVMQSDFRESLCRDIPTTEEYFQCKESNDFDNNYKLIKRVKNIDLIENKGR